MKKPLLSAAKAHDLIKKYGAPLYVYRRDVIATRYQEFDRAIRWPKKRIFYACKANANTSILQLLRKLGASIECVSRGEVERAMQAGFPATRISYTCSNIPRTELEWLIRKKVSVYIDSLNQLEWWGQLHPNSDVSIRLNLGYGDGGHKHLTTGGEDSKFGIYHGDITKVKRIAHQYNLRIVGLLQHIGTSVKKPHSLLRAMSLVFDAASQFPDLQYLDFGGGFSIPYRPEEQTLDLPELGKKVSTSFAAFCKRYGRELELRTQPGRYVVAEAGALIAPVIDIKENPGNTFVGINSGFSHLIRPVLYGAYHHIFNLSNQKGRLKKVHIVGSLCESADFLAKNRSLPTPRIGDVLLIADSGAYGYSMASDYNLREKPKEIVID